MPAWPHGAPAFSRTARRPGRPLTLVLALARGRWCWCRLLAGTRVWDSVFGCWRWTAPDEAWRGNRALCLLAVRRAARALLAAPRARGGLLLLRHDHAPLEHELARQVCAPAVPRAQSAHPGPWGTRARAGRVAPRWSAHYVTSPLRASHHPPPPAPPTPDGRRCCDALCRHALCGCCAVSPALPLPPARLLCFAARSLLQVFEHHSEFTVGVDFNMFQEGQARAITITIASASASARGLSSDSCACWHFILSVEIPRTHQADLICSGCASDRLMRVGRVGARVERGRDANAHDGLLNQILAALFD